MAANRLYRLKDPVFKALSIARGLSLLTMVALFLGSSWLGPGPWTTLLPWITLAALLQCIVVARGINRYTGYALFLAGMLLFHFSRAPFSAYLTGITTNTGILSLLIAVPILGLPLPYCGYIDAIDQWYARQSGNPKRRLLSTIFLAQTLGAFLNIAGVTLAHQILVRKEEEAIFQETHLVRGYTAATPWSPNMNPVPLTIQYYGLNLAKFLPLVMVTGLIYSFLSWVFGCRSMKTHSEVPKENGSGIKKTGSEALNLRKPVTGDLAPVEALELPERRTSSFGKRSVGELAFIGILLIAFLLVMEAISGKGVFATIPLVALIFPLIWSLILHKTGAWWHALTRGYWSKLRGHMHNEALIFLGAGFFGSSLHAIGVDRLIPKLILALSGGNPWGVSIIIALMFIGIAFIGVHPIVTATAILSTVDPHAIGVSSTFIGLLITGSWALATTLSPFSGVTLAMAGITGQSPFHLGPRRHTGFVALALVLFLLWVNLIRVLS